jgi:hypothetical protein
MKGLGVRMARALNRMLGKKGAVYAERYHATVLRTPAEVARALDHVLDHATRLGLIRRNVDQYSSATPEAAAYLVAAARSWLLATAGAARRLSPRRSSWPPVW